MALKKSIYKISKTQLSKIEKNQLKEFVSDFRNGNNIEIDFYQRNYKVNSKSNSLIDSKTQAISFFSGAGGLDIGTQLAGIKVISSLDFDKDSVATMQSNKFFSNSIHLHKDIKDIKGSEYKTIIKTNNPEKLILVGGPPCQPFSKAGYWQTHENRLGADDPRNMIGNYLRLISDLKPNGFVLENVESILHPKNIHAFSGCN